MKLKLVVVGDGAVGKTCLLVVYVRGDFPQSYVPTVFENYTAKVMVANQQHTIQLWDTAGQEDLCNIRQLSYANTDVFIICFSIDNRTSFDNVRNVWIPELKKSNPNPVVLLVGTKTDIRSNQNKDSCLAEIDGERLKTEIGAFAYVECSAKANKGVKQVFDTAIQHCTQGDPGCRCEVI